jgi:uncharacterized membrane protein
MKPNEPPPDCQSFANFLRTELQEFDRTLRSSHDHQRIAQAVARLRLALGDVESIVANPKQRYAWSPDQQWSFVSLFAYVQEVKQELKSVARHYS